MRIWVAVSLILVSGIVPAITVHAESDADLLEKVVKASPWRGAVGSSRVEFSFSKDPRGRLQGELESTTASPAFGPSTGPVKWPELKGGKLTFTTPVGADYELAIDQKGHLVGSARITGYPPVQVDLAPSR